MGEVVIAQAAFLAFVSGDFATWLDVASIMFMVPCACGLITVAEGRLYFVTLPMGVAYAAVHGRSSSITVSTSAGDSSSG